MIERILRFSLRQRFWICLAGLFLAVLGLYNLSELSIEAVPDVTNRQVQINAICPALGPEDVEKRVTFPLEVALGGLPRVQNFRSISQFGLSQVTVIFEDDTNIYFARQLVGERLQEARASLPPAVTLQMAPVSTGLGEILYLRLRNPKLSLMERRRLMDWVVRPRLRCLQGLADVNVWGGQVRQLQVRVDPLKLREFGLDLDKVSRAVEENNANGGGSFLERGPEQQLVSSQGLLRGAEDLRQIVLKQEQRQSPVTLAQVAEVVPGPMLRQGALTQDGQDEEVYAMCLLLLGENGYKVVQGVKAVLPDLERSLPPGSRLEPFLDRSRLIAATLKTASRNLAEGGFLVIALLFFFLLQLRAGMIVSSAIPLSMLMAVMGMRYFNISANLMSLGAIDFGLIVDGAVIIVENCVRRLSLERERVGRALSQQERLDVIGSAASEVRSATQLGELIILSTYIPILSLQGIEGKMFRPMGWTVILALTGAMILSFTLIPALCGYFLKAELEPEHPLVSRWERWYERLVRRSLDFGPWLVGLALTLLLVAGLILPRLGSEFIPELDEGAIAVQVTFPTGISLPESVRQSQQLERLVRSTLGKRAERVVTRIGRPEIATDPMLTSQTDMIVELAPGTSRARVVEELSRVLEERAGVEFSFTQPIKMRMMELIEGVGVRADLGVKIYGSEPLELKRLGDRTAELLKQVPGAADVMVEITQGQPQLQIDIDRAELARTGLNVSDVNRVLEAALGGRAVTSINDGNERCDVTVALDEKYRNDPDAFASLLVPAGDGSLIPLRRLAHITSRLGPVQISREQGKRRLVVQANVRGRDLGSFVEEAREVLNRQLPLPTGYYLEYGGTYEKLQSGRARLALVVPITFALVFGLLFLNFGELWLAVLVFTGIPLAVSGGVLALWVRSMPLSISAAIGFVALAGVAVLNGVVLITFLESLRAQGLSPREAAVQGSRSRLRPVLMTAAVASFGFIPMALSTGAGAEVQKPLATVVIGGLVTATMLTLLILPVVYTGWLERRRKPEF
ncbi:MAG: CusA/CzcA family heavy metal efflux RND transporter [Vulcanimicrobiota bacterium]